MIFWFIWFVVINSIIIKTMRDEDSMQWRVALSVQIIPAIVLIVSCIFIPESPRYWSSRANFFLNSFVYLMLMFRKDGSVTRKSMTKHWKFYHLSEDTHQFPIKYNQNIHPSKHLSNLKNNSLQTRLGQTCWHLVFDRLAPWIKHSNSFQAQTWFNITLRLYMLLWASLNSIRSSYFRWQITLFIF